jgi:hypothetical protein
MQNTVNILRKTNWDLFEDQKQWLLEQMDINAFGLIEFIDSLQDAIIEDGICSESEVFPNLETKNKKL